MVVSSSRASTGKERGTMKCFQCGKGQLVSKSTEIAGKVRGETLTVRSEAAVCNMCGFQVLSKAQSSAYGIAVADAYRERHGLLTSKELKTIRKRLAMSQRDFAVFLGVGVASVKRWDAGLIQDEAMDRLVRLGTDPQAARTNLEQLERRLGDEPDPARLPVAARRKPVAPRRAKPGLTHSLRLRPPYAVFSPPKEPESYPTLLLAAA